MNDPIGDAVRSIVDGHIVLTRQLAHRGHFPAVDVLQSASRVMKAVAAPEHVKLAQKMREVLATYKEAEDLINIGAYKPGSNVRIDKAIKVIDAVNDFLRQTADDPTSYTQTIRRMQQILANA